VVENADEGMRIWNQRGPVRADLAGARRGAQDGRRGGVSLAQVAIAWLMARPAVSSVIRGARSMGQLTGNMAAAELKLTLTPEETQLLDEASQPPVPGPPHS
jgi:aryl-alcohol dehydrogenase-like predicted oxidoreductase